MNKADAYDLWDSKRGSSPHGTLLPVEWGARVNYRTWTDGWFPVDTFTLHYFGGNPIGNTIADVRWAENIHIDQRGWRGVGYDFMIVGDGTIAECRAFNVSGAQFGTELNRRCEATQFTVGGSQEPTAKQWASYEWLRREVLVPIHGNQILKGHKETDPVNNPTSCPGGVIFPYVESHRFLEPTEELVLKPENEALFDAFGDWLRGQSAGVTQLQSQFNAWLGWKDEYGGDSSAHAKKVKNAIAAAAAGNGGIPEHEHKLGKTGGVV
jgi:hypothetical protein